MWLRLALAAIVIVAVGREAQAASSWFWCEPYHAYYPWVRSCPEGWRRVDPWSPSSQQPQYDQSQASPQDGTAPVPSSTADQPTFPSPITASRGDGLDQWCQGSITALNMAICTDNDLRAAAVQRLHAFDDAKARLSPDRQKALAADQNGWAMSYAQSCGLPSNVAPPLPLPPAVKECLAHAGQQRLAYLQSYASPAAANPSAPPADPSPATSIPETAQTPPAGSGATPDKAAAAQQPATQPALPAATSPAPANVPPTGANPPATNQPAVVSCNATSRRGSANPFDGSRHLPALGTLQGGTMVGSFALAAATICLWVFAFFRKARNQPR